MSILQNLKTKATLKTDFLGNISLAPKTILSRLRTRVQPTGIIYGDITKTPVISALKQAPQKETIGQKISAFVNPSPIGVRPQDVIREIPQAIGETGKKATGFAKDILQEITRSGGSVGLTLAMKDELPIDNSSPKWQQKTQEIIFGKEPVKSLSTRIAEGELRIQPYLKKVGAEKAALPIAFGGVALMTGLDFTGAGGEKNVLKVLAKAEDVGFIAKTLRQIGVAEDFILTTAQKMAKVKNEKEIKVALDKISEIQKVSKTPQVADPLIQENKIFYHGTSKASATNIKNAGGFTPETIKNIKDLAGFDVPVDRPISLTLDKKTAELYSGIRPEGGNGELLAFKGDNLKIATESQAKKLDNDITKLRKAGFDGYNTSSPHDELVETIVFNKEKLKLINNSSPLIQEAKLYRAGKIDISKSTEQGISLTKSKEYAKSFGDARGIKNIDTTYLDSNAKILKDIPKDLLKLNKDGSYGAKNGVKLEFAGKDEFQDIVDYARNNGYDAVDLSKLNVKPGQLGEQEIRVINPKVIKSKASPLIQEAKTIIPKTQFTSPKVERGFITSAKETIPEAKKIAGQYIPRDTDTLAIKARNLIRDDFATAKKLALTGTDDTAVATASELLKHYSQEAEKATSEAIKNAMYDKAAEVANTIAPKLTESGRAVQAASILGRLTPEGQVKFAASQISKYNEAVGLSKKIPELTGEQAKNIVTEMKIINKMPDGTKKAMRLFEVQNYISDLVPTPLFKKIVAVWKAGLLTGMKTTGVNIFANVSHFATEVAKDIPATMIDKVISLFTGTRTKAFNLKGTLGGGKEGIKKGLRYLITGFDERNIGTKLDYRRINFGKGKIAQGLQKYTDTIFHLLGTEDQPFYYAAKLRSFYEQAKVEAINKGLKGEEAQKFIDELIQNPTEQMIKYATTDAEGAVFQNKTALGEAARQIQKIGGGAGEIVVPFGRTPSAVAMRIWDYSPGGLFTTILKNIGKGKFDQRLFSEGIARGLTGTGILSLGMFLYKKGLVTTSRPTTEREQKLWELEGKQPNSIKIGGKWRQANVLGPLGNMLLVGGSFQKAFNNSGSVTEAMTQGLFDAVSAFTQQTFLTGVENLLNIISDPARYAKSYVSSQMASVIPTFVGDVARATDSMERRTNDIFDRFFAKIPGVRETLEPQIDVLGQERETVGNPLEIMADPTRPSPSKSSPVIEELRRLWDAGQKVSPTLLGDKAGYGGLTPEQNTNLWKRAGEITNQKLNSLFSKEEYKKLSDEEKGKITNTIVDKSKIVARAEAVIELTQGLQGEELKAKLSELKKSGLMTNEVFKKYMELR